MTRADHATDTRTGALITARGIERPQSVGRA
jgi:hypothetical protein